jgi:hypothetical protein
MPRRRVRLTFTLAERLREARLADADCNIIPGATDAGDSIFGAHRYPFDYAQGERTGQRRITARLCAGVRFRSAAPSRPRSASGLPAADLEATFTTLALHPSNASTESVLPPPLRLRTDAHSSDKSVRRQGCAAKTKKTAPPGRRTVRTDRRRLAPLPRRRNLAAERKYPKPGFCG